MSELEQALVALGRDLDVPETPDLVAPVLGQLEPRPRARPRRRWALAVAFALFAALVATMAIPDARSAVFRFLHIGGEEIEFVEELPEVPAQPDLGLILGQRVSLAAARARAGFDLRELDEPPDTVYLGDRGTVWFLYGTPERVRLLLAQTPELAVEPAFMKKAIGSGTNVETASVDGAPGYFLSGAPHVLLLVDANGAVIEESARLAQDVLVWSEGGVTYRIEGDFSLDEAMRFARSLH
jgi:hypothetical protein